ncbi:MAG: hypothetical protein R6W90_14480 [Ignavibacteriaceae bacterium]
MKILAIEKDMPGVREGDYKPLLKSEAEKAWELYKSGVIRELYFSDKHYAVLMLECDSAGDARGVLDSLPLVKERLIDFEIIPLQPYNGFERLFEK